MVYYVNDQDNNYIVPILPENILTNLNEDTLVLYSDITLFFKKEYNKIVQINQLAKENKKLNININLNISILEKIKAFAEETFNYILNNYHKNEQQLNIKKKLRLLLNHIDEYKSNFNLDKYLKLENEEFFNKTSNQMNYNSFNIFKDKLSLTHNFLSKTNYINNGTISAKRYAKNNLNMNEINKEKEEQKQSSESNNSKINNKPSYLTGRFNSFYRQYNPNSLEDKMTNQFLYQFFNYKKNKYELDKSLGKISMP